MAELKSLRVNSRAEFLQKVVSGRDLAFNDRQKVFAKVYDDLEKEDKVGEAGGVVFKTYIRWIAFMMREEMMTKKKAIRAWHKLCNDESTPRRWFGKKVQLPVRLYPELARTLSGSKKRTVRIEAECCLGPCGLLLSVQSI